MGDGKSLRVGIIGCGALGAIHARKFSEMPGVEVSALSDPDLARVHRGAAALPAPPACQAADYHELLRSPLDAVCIASPDALHVAQVLDSLDAGLHILCEKPLTLDPDELQRVIAARDRSGKHVAMSYQRRYHGGVRAIRREVQSGQWGRVKTVTAYNAEDWVTPNRGAWRHDPALCPGGFLYDANSHQVDFLLWTTGLEVELVWAEIDNRGTPVPIVIWGTARLTGDVPFTFSFVGDGHSWREQVNIHCEGMDFCLENGRALWTKDGKLNPITPVEATESSNEAFVNLIHGAGINWAPPEETGPVLRFTRAALASAGESDRWNEG